MPTRSERRKQLKKRRRMVFATVTGCFLLTGFIPAQTAQAPVGQHVLKEITGDYYTYTPSSVSTSNDQQQPVDHPYGKTDASKNHLSDSADHSSQLTHSPAVAMKPENKPSVTAPTYVQPKPNTDHSNGTTANEREQSSYEPNPAPEPASTDQPSRKPRRDDSGQPSQTEPSNPPDSQTPPSQEQPPQPPDDQPGDGDQGNGGNNGDHGLVEGILNPLLNTVDKTLP
ncbi:hypothetical protein [Polycladomyces abyssicola]|nr:hypothetical protein [Polycladomyces abyssicola]